MLPPTRSNEGYRLLNLGQLAEAEAEFRAALEADPKDLKCMLGLAKTQLASRNVDDALATLQQVFALKPDHLEAKSLRGLLLVDKGDAKGVKDLEEAAKDRRSGPQEHLNYGLYLAEKDDNKAQKEFELVLRVDARNTKAHLELAKIAERRGDYRSALVKYQKACEFASPNDPEPHVLKSRAHYALGETSHGSMAMLDAINRAPEDSKRGLFEEGYRLAYDAREFQAALNIAVAALELNPDEPEYQKWRDDAQAAAKNAGAKPKSQGTTELWKEEAPKTASHTAPAPPPLGAAPAGQTNPNATSADAICKQAEAHLLKSPPDVGEAMKIIEPFLAANPNHGRGNMNKGLALALSKQYAQALPFAQKAQASQDPHIRMEANALVSACQRKLKAAK